MMTQYSILWGLIFSLFITLVHMHASAHAEEAGKAVSVSGRVLVRTEDGKTQKMAFLKPGDTLGKGSVLNTSSVGAVKLLMTDKTILDLGPSTLFKVNEYKLNQGSDRNVDMEMSYGKIRASVNTPVGAKGKFTIRTKAATMGVRGTEFIVSSDVASFMAPEAKATKDGAKNMEMKEPPKNVVGKTEITVIKGSVNVETKVAQLDKNKKEMAGVKTEITKLEAGSKMVAIEKPMEVKDLAKGFAAQEARVETKIEKLTTEQLKTETASAKQDDRTFAQAISVPASGAEGDKGSGGHTLAAVGNMISNSHEFQAGTPTLPVNVGTPGMFNSSEFNRPNDRPNIQAGQAITVTVEFRK